MQRARGFTFLELIIVIAVIGVPALLATQALGRTQGVGALPNGTRIESNVRLFHSRVIPEPGTSALLILCAAWMLRHRRRGCRRETFKAVDGVRPSRARG